MTNYSAADAAPSIRQHTLARSAQWRAEWRRRRSDVLIVHPAEADTGVCFVYHGARPIAGTILARWDMVVDTHGGLVLGNSHGATLRGVTPLLAALRVAGVDNAVVELYGPRIPAEVSDFDFYLDMLTDVGVQAQAEARRLLCVVDTVEVRDSLGFATLSPASEFRACVNTTTTQLRGNPDTLSTTLLSDFTEPYAGFSATPGGSRAEWLTLAGNTNVSRRLPEICALPEALRARAIELIGHLALSGAPIAGCIRSHGSGPGLYQALLHAVMQRRAVSLTTVDAHRARHTTATRTGVGPAGTVIDTS
jgi:UDP-3-O-[3-hydroxymyristoyl] N-acetylglucosamine deacetylase